MASERLPRKLAAIFYADVAGYSRLTGEDEDATHRRLRDYLDLIAKTIDDHHGQVMHYAGDAVLAKFDAVVDTLSSAVAIQNELKDRNQDLPDERKVQFRIGVNLGDVIEDRGDIYGDGVNVAARLESLADEGGICISESVRTAIGKKLDLTYESMGEQKVKNIDEPVRAYRVLMGSQQVSKTTSPNKPALALPDKPSIAVLPFTNMSGDPEQAYFSDGITEDITAMLARMSGLVVVGQHSTLADKGRAVDIKKVGREQGVRYLLEGSVQKGGSRVRVTAQLIDTTTGHHVWADRYDRELDDIFSVQDEITRNVTVGLQVQLTDGEAARVWSGGTNDIRAWECAVRGIALVDGMIKEDNLKGRRLAESAAELDPEYVWAWVVLGHTHLDEAEHGWSKSIDRSLEMADEAAHKALDLDDSDPDACVLLGSIYRMRGESDRALELCQKAAALSPGTADMQAFLANSLLFAGRAQEAIRYIEKAMRLAPIYPHWYRLILGHCLSKLGETDKAIGVLNELVALAPESPVPRLNLVAVLTKGGLSKEAKTVAGDVLRLEPTISVKGFVQGYHHDPAEREKLLTNLLEAGLPE